MPLNPSPLDTEAMERGKSLGSNEGETKSIINLQLYLDSAAANNHSKDKSESN